MSKKDQGSGGEEKESWKEMRKSKVRMTVALEK